MKSLKQYIKERLSVNKVGTIDDDHTGYYGPICEMARLGYIPKKNSKQYYEVVVWTDDPGYIPHVHIRDVATKGREFDCCVKLEVPEYFPHGKHKDTMNSQMVKAFVEFMRSKPLKSKAFNTNYEVTVDVWNLNNSSVEIEVQYDLNGNPIIPDYNKLK